MMKSWSCLTSLHVSVTSRYLSMFLKTWISYTLCYTPTLYEQSFEVK